MAETIGDRLDRLIRERNMSKAELARRSGATRQNIGQIISGANKGGISAPMLFSIADVLGVHARWLLYGTGAQDRRQRFDQVMLARIFSDVVTETERLDCGWDQRKQISLAVSLYGLWEQTGEHPDPGQSVRLIASQDRAG